MKVLKLSLARTFDTSSECLQNIHTKKQASESIEMERRIGWSKIRNKQVALIRQPWTGCYKKDVVVSHPHQWSLQRGTHRNECHRDNQRQAGGFWRHTYACGETGWSASALWFLFLLWEKGGMWRRGPGDAGRATLQETWRSEARSGEDETHAVIGEVWVATSWWLLSDSHAQKTA